MHTEVSCHCERRGCAYSRGQLSSCIADGAWTRGGGSCSTCLPGRSCGARSRLSLQLLSLMDPLAKVTLIGKDGFLLSCNSNLKMLRKVSCQQPNSIGAASISSFHAKLFDFVWPSLAQATTSTSLPSASCVMTCLRKA
jgi:hypothetical protein